jgi:Ca-activated chloride channel family protein
MAVALAGAAAAQDSGPRVAIAPRTVRQLEPRRASSIRVDTNLVLIPVTVTNPIGAPVMGLLSRAFHIFEDGVEQQVRYFNAQDAPVSLGVVFDASRSMEGKLEQSRAAVSHFFRTAMSGDEFFLIEFNDTPRLLCDFTTNTAAMEKSLVGIRPKNWTALLDAVYMAVHQTKRAKNTRKALLIISDGGDNYSRYTETETKAMVRESDVCIYSIALTGGGLMRRHVRLLRQLSEETGGRTCEVDKLSALPEAVQQLSAAMRNQYLLGYSSNRKNDGLYRKVQVRLQQPADEPPLRASWRTGYYSPAME